MGFNFGAFLGGMGTQISENIESEKKFQREKDFRLEMLGEEEATKMRLAKAEEKRLQRTKDAERELYEKQLENARIAAFEERKRLKSKYGRGGGV